MPADTPPPFYDVFIDESSQTQSRHLVIGGAILPQSLTEGFTQELLRCRAPELNADGEMKWNKVSRAKLAAYKRLVDLFFDAQVAAEIHFHSLVVDTSKVNHRRFNDGSREIGFSKEIYQLSLKFGRLYPGLFHIYPDGRDTKETPDKVRTMLNFGIRKRGDSREWPYRRMQFRNSKHTPILQLVDILIGALAYELNEHSTALNASPAKTELSQHVLKRAKVSRVHNDTAVGGKFTIWHRRLK